MHEGNPQDDLAAERRVLGWLVVMPDDLATVSTLLRPADFASEEHHILYGLLLELGSAVGYVSLADTLEERGLLERIGGREFLLTIVADIPTGYSVTEDALLVATLAAQRRRRMREVGP